MIDKTRKPLTTRAWLTRLSPAPGLVTAPIPITTTSYEPSSTTDLEIKQQAAAVERLYADNSVTLSPTCELAKLIV
jgi:hypothetical protein